ncbi:MAG: HAMP domain-containing histidine kinase [Nitrospirae bacterium]|nr:HAMP domain-containing histidine kinase [Nitrospirota bacterium]
MFSDCLDKWYICGLKRLKRVLDKQLAKRSTAESDLEDNVQGLADRRPRRRRFTIKAHIYIVFVVSLVIAMSIGAALLLTMFMMEKNLHFIETANKYVYLVYETRDRESDYVLYGKGLNESLETVRKLEEIVLEHYGDLKKNIDYENMVRNIEKYGKLLEDVEELEGTPQAAGFAEKKEKLKAELRKYGSEMLNAADVLMKKEVESTDKMMLLFRLVHIYALVFLFVFILMVLHLLGYRVLRSLNRFASYTKLMASGQYMNIVPDNSYSDEFYDLSLAIDQMLKDLDRQQNILAQSQKLRAVGTLTAGIAHELNNPINNITLTAHMLLEDYNDLPDEERLDMVKDLIEEAGRARNIVRNLLDFARESETIMEPIGLGEVLKETLKLANHQIKIAGVNMDLKIASNMPRIHGDRHQLEQVFLNLILNALDVTVKGGLIKIEVAVSDEPNFAAVKITDYGQGIPDHILHHIFDPFFTTKAKGKGTGLGLSVSQGIIAKHGGQISVSTKVRRGTTFNVKLPITTIPADLDKRSETAIDTQMTQPVL